MRTKSAAASIALVCLVLGLMISYQYKASTSEPSTASSYRWSEQTVELENLRKQNDALVNEVVSLRSKLAMTDSNQQTAALKDELAKANLSAGLLPVVGSGIIVTINDSSSALLAGDDPNDYIVHDWNLLFIINELKAAGAEAISVNGERITASSEVRCAGPTILINLTRLTPPFEIKATGNATALESSLRLKGGEIEALILRGIKVNIQKADYIEIPAFRGAVKYEYSKPK